MKTKVILYTLLSIVCLTPTRANDKELDPVTEKKYWDFIKERLFDGQTNFVSKFKKNIYIYLDTQCKDDSVIVNNLIVELQKLIPNRKIGYCKSLSLDQEINKDKEVIIVGNRPINSNSYVKRSKNINGNQIFYDGFKGIWQEDIYMQQIQIQLNDSTTYSNRKRYLEYAILRSLCTIKGNPQEAHTFFPNAVFNDFDYEPYNTEFSEVDKYLLKKLYSEDFNEQFRNYLLNIYPRSYYRAFLYKEQYQSVKTLIAILIVLFVIAISYKTIIFKQHKRRFTSYILIGILVGTTAITVHLVLQNIASTGEYSSRTNLIISSGLFIISVTAASILYFIEFLFIHPKMSYNKKMLLKIIFAFLIVCVPSILLKLVITKFDSARMINFITFGLVFAIGRGFLIYIKEVGDSAIRRKDFELIKLKELTTNAEMQSLYSKINPHFLYNSLNSIAGLARSNPEKTQKMAIALSDLYKYSTNRLGEQTSSVKNEVEMVKTYLEIEKIRFGERLNYSFQIDDEVNEILIPRNILQPLVENSIKHGISKIEDEGIIKLSIQKSDKGIIIKVFDNGPFFNDGLISGFGLKSIQNILKLYYKGNAELCWQNEPSKMVVVEINSLS